MKIIKNIQNYQTLVLSCVLMIGVNFYGLDISIWEILVTFTTVIGLDFIFSNFPRDKTSTHLQFPHSGINAGFGICFFLRSFDIFTYFFAAILAIVGKHAFRIQGRHFFNPSNFGVFITLILFPQYAWVNTLQWGNYTGTITSKYTIAITMVICLGIFMTYQVYKNFRYKYLIDFTLPFLLTHWILFFTIPFYEPISSFFIFFNVSFFIFTFFMITDPKTIPMTSLGRTLYAISLPGMFYVLQFFINESYAILGSLFCNTILLPVIWNLEKNKRNLLLFYSAYYTILTLVIGMLIIKIGRPDLVFNNVCNQLFCR